MQPALLNLPDSFQTERLTVRCARPGDGARVYDALVESLYELRKYPASLPWALETPTVERSELFCREGLSEFIARRDFRFLMLLRETDTIVGCCGLHRADWTVPAIEAGWWGRTSFLGRGFVSEAVASLIGYAFVHLHMRRVSAFVDDLNEKSARVCERVGMKLEGVLRHERADPDGTLRHTRVYAALSAS